MAVDKNKVTAEATRLVQKGQFDKAIRAYERILAEDPRDVRVLLKVGELQQKKGDPAGAAQTFNLAAEAYGEQGFFLKAVAVYKQILKLAPEDVRVNERLAGLYQQLGILSDAMGQLGVVAAAAERAGDGSKLLQVLKRMVELEPDNVGSAVKLGELYAKMSETKLAVEQLRRAAEQLRKNNRTDEYVKVAERISFLSPNDAKLTRELANIYLAKGDTKRGLAKLQLCFKDDPKDTETLSLLAQAFKDLGQVSKTVSVYRELAHVHAERGNAAEVQATWRRVLELAPDDQEAASALGAAVAPPPVPVAGAARQTIPPPAMKRATPGTIPPVAKPPPPPAGRLGPEAIPKLLTETEVYVKYGLHEKALEHLQKVFAIDPDHLEAREKAFRLRIARDDLRGAADEAAAVARIALARGMEDRAQAALTRLRELAPDHPGLRGVEAESDVIEVSIDAEDVVLEVEPPQPGDDAIAIEAARAPTDDTVEEEAPVPRRPPGRRPTVPPPMPRGPSLTVVPPQGAPTAKIPGPVLVAPPPRPTAPPAPPPPRRAAPPPQAEAPQEDLGDEIEEADFFIQQGLLDDAREVLQNLLAFYPGHRGVEAKLKALDQLTAQERAPKAGAVPAPPPEDFDIGRELAQELGAAPEMIGDVEVGYSVNDVFSQFKKGVAETVKPEDSETHYDLGIAYKEMGLLDDAVHEFEVALNARGRKKDIECLTMLAICRMEKSDHSGAVRAFQQALRSDYVTPEAARAIHYDIGCAYEAMGDGQAAVFYLNKVIKVDPGYRDAATIVERLGGGPGRAPEADERPGAAPAEAKPTARKGPPGSSKKNIGFL